MVGTTIRGGQLTPSELLALVGRSWSRLLLYPGGLAAFGCVWLVRAVARRQWPWRDLPLLLGSAPVLPLAAAWLAIALLPLPGAVDLGRSIDVVAVLALLDLALLTALADDLCADARRSTGIERLAAALNGYPTLVLALLTLGFSSGSLELATTMRVPAESGVLATLHWLGAGALVLALPPLLGLGAFTAAPRNAMWLGLALRGVGYTTIAALPLIVLGTGPWQPLPVLVLAGMLAWFHAATAATNARDWARGYLALDLVLLLALVGAAGFTLWQRFS